MRREKQILFVVVRVLAEHMVHIKGKIAVRLYLRLKVRLINLRTQLALQIRLDQFPRSRIRFGYWAGRQATLMALAQSCAINTIPPMSVKLQKRLTETVCGAG